MWKVMRLPMGRMKSIVRKAKMLRSLLKSVDEAGGYNLYFIPGHLKKITAMDLINQLGPNNIEFVYKGKKKDEKTKWTRKCPTEEGYYFFITDPTKKVGKVQTDIVHCHIMDNGEPLFEFAGDDDSYYRLGFLKHCGAFIHGWFSPKIEMPTFNEEVNEDEEGVNEEIPH